MRDTSISDLPFDIASQTLLDTYRAEASKAKLQTGVRNFLLFQRFNLFNWPAWVQEQVVSPSAGFTSSVFPMILNGSVRDGMIFSNFFSREELFIDPAGMVTPSYGEWSVELWVIHGRKVYRAASAMKKVFQQCDPQTSIITSRWEEDFGSVRYSIFGARSSIDEAYVDVECSIKKKKEDTALLVCLRPYTHRRLGGIRRIDYEKGSRMVSINGKEHFSPVTDPDFVTAAHNGRDIDPFDQEDSFSSASDDGMAAIALGYRLKKGGNRMFLRISLDGKENLPAGNFKLETLEEDFTSFTSMRLSGGATLKIQDRNIQRWFNASKVSLLHLSEKDYLLTGTKGYDFHDALLYVYGCDRMGFFKEAGEIIETLSKDPSLRNKKPGRHDILNSCYYIIAVGDLFTHIRDIDYLQSVYPGLKVVGETLMKFTSKIKKVPLDESGAIGECYIDKGHPYELAVMAHADEIFAYLARCIGIFGDELKFGKEGERLTGLFKQWLSLDEYIMGDNCFMVYNGYALYPFGLNTLEEGEREQISNDILKRNGPMPIFMSPFGIDVLNTLLVSNILIHSKDERGYDAAAALMKMEKDRLSLSDYIHPKTGRGTFGRGGSKVAGALMFLTIRNMLFIDYPDRLELFPVPRDDWFKPGREIQISGAPSRFGSLTIRVVSTSNEIQIFFEELPKFVPPEIMINLPGKVKIREGDDFIVKWEEDDINVINGWPEIVRFQRK